MSVDLNIAVTCVMSDAVRRADLVTLRRRIGRPVIVIDGDGLGLWPAVRRAWQTLMISSGTHALVMAEDMLPCRRFYDLATAALEARSDSLVNFFTPRLETLVAPARERGVHWGLGADATWGGSVAMPREWIGEFLRWEAEMISPDYPHDDGRLALWAIETGREVWVTVPSLLQHVGASRSVTGHGGITRNRVAAWYVDDPGDIDWTLGLLNPARSPRMLGPVTRKELRRIRGLAS